MINSRTYSERGIGQNPSTPPSNNEGSNKRLAMNIVNQLGDLWKVPVDVRQATNDQCDDFVEALINKRVISELEALLPKVIYGKDQYHIMQQIEALKKEMEDK